MNQTLPARLAWLSLLASLVVAAPSRGQARDSFTLQRIGNPGNAPDPAPLPDGSSGFGAVPYVYWMSRTEVTVAQYVQFLNAVARSDPNGLFDPFMQNPPCVGPGFCPEQYAQIQRVGSPGSFVYSVVPGQIPPTGHSRADVPVLFIDFFRAVRFANWLHNGQPTGQQGPGTTESGAYTIDGVTVTRNPGARWAVPTADEWHKAAYGNVGDTYTLFATDSDVSPTAWLCDLGPSIGNANLFRIDQLWVDQPTPVGCYPVSSFWGVKDMHGNAWEWTEEDRDGLRVFRGGDMRTLDGSGFGSGTAVRAAIAESPFFNGIGGRTLSAGGLGFRVVALCPADIDGDGDADVADFFAFVATFAAGDLSADLDGDGSIAVGDFFAFVSAFAAGCP